MGRKLYVGNFPYETGEGDLQDLFARAGTVETVKVMRDMATGPANRHGRGDSGKPPDRGRPDKPRTTRDVEAANGSDETDP